jgi:RimJ/RimL family protein N-acetyltransferase
MVWERWGFGIYWLSDCRDGTLVGRADLRHVAINGHDEIEVAYVLFGPCWGSGIAVEVT